MRGLPGIRAFSHVLRASARAPQIAMAGRAAASGGAPRQCAQSFGQGDVVYACNVYVSEGQDDTIIQRLKDVASAQPSVRLAWTFVDRPYHRTGLTLVSRHVAQLTQSILDIATECLQHLDLRQHAATHPRLGVIDHISLHPLQPTAATSAAGEGLASAARCAREASAGLGAMGLPVYLYGHARDDRRTLADIRRQLGYFQTRPQAQTPSNTLDSKATTTSTAASSSGSSAAGLAAASWSGPVLSATAQSLPVQPDYGPHTPNPRWGVVTVGVRPWVANYNIPLTRQDSLGTGDKGNTDESNTDMLLRQGRVVARLASERGGGLPFVEAMALLHEGGAVEVACNLLDPHTITPQHVQSYVDKLATQHGLCAHTGYLTNLTVDELTQLTR